MNDRKSPRRSRMSMNTAAALTPSPVESSGLGAARIPPPDDGVINILIVDDEPKNLTVLETVLNQPGYRLVRAESADQALLALVAEEFALLILDVRMPGMTGFELAQMIKERKKTADVPIIFLTAYYNDDQHVLEGYKVAPEIAKHRASASILPDWWAYKMEAYDAIPFNAAIMTRRGIVVSIHSDSNEAARRFYRAMGFYETVLVPGYYRGGEGRKEGAIKMLRVLRAPGPTPYTWKPPRTEDKT